MILEIVSIYDQAIGAYSRPVFVQSTGVAIRSFSDEVNREDQNNEMKRHPADFSLFHLGSFDDSTGLFVNIEPLPALLVQASNVITKE